MGKGKRGKLLIYFTCPAGAGSSTMIKLKAQEVIDAHDLTYKVELDAVGSSFINENSCDILVCTLNLSEKFARELPYPVVGLKNVVSSTEYEEKMLPVIYKLLEAEAEK
jgi:galactitol-specific phosphotransferase system IIB component